MRRSLEDARRSCSCSERRGNRLHDHLVADHVTHYTPRLSFDPALLGLDPARATGRVRAHPPPNVPAHPGAPPTRPGVVARADSRTNPLTGSFLRASLFTSVISFGVAALAMGLGFLFVLLGIALVKVSKSVVVTSVTSLSSSPTPTPTTTKAKTTVKKDEPVAAKV